jgi:glycosyltransferase involved in cell wall biosynthesis
MVVQLVREWPPGFGGVERVAHEIADSSKGTVYSFDYQRKRVRLADSLPVKYTRVLLKGFRLGRIMIPRPDKKLFYLINDTRPIIGHLPSVEVLLVLLILRWAGKKRKIAIYWHAIIQSNANSPAEWLYKIYQLIAVRMLFVFDAVIVTSPILSRSLQDFSGKALNIFILPCSIPERSEIRLLEIPILEAVNDRQVKLLYIGRLESYKRLDLVFDVLKHVEALLTLTVIGDGPLRSQYEQQFAKLNKHNVNVAFYGAISEEEKIDQIQRSDYLILPSVMSNEAFGIVQLEAMAAGRATITFNPQNSGLGWVCDISSLQWEKSPEALLPLLENLSQNQSLRITTGVEARERYLELFARSKWCKNLHSILEFLE